jgi:formamidopyrimidine-DNA glycosylase
MYKAMPELPEVETVRRGLEPALAGQRIERVHLGRADLRVPFPPRFAKRLAGRRIERLGRRAKYLLAELDGDETLVIHLGMSGQLTLSNGALARSPINPQDLAAHDHVLITLEGGRALLYNDPRRFGLMTLVPTSKLGTHKLFRRLGIEPLDGALSGELLRRRLAKRRTSLKAALIDQGVIAGIGNIYACEALHRARLSPRRLALSLNGDRADRLAKAVGEVLSAAIEAGGSSLRDYVRSDGSPGYFQHRFAVYDRAGERCPRAGCRGIVRRIVQSSRSSFFCPTCQR